MAYLLAHDKKLFGLVAQCPTVPEEMRTTAKKVAALPIDSVIDDLAWLELIEAVASAKFAGKRELLSKIDRLTRGGG